MGHTGSQGSEWVDFVLDPSQTVGRVVIEGLPFFGVGRHRQLFETPTNDGWFESFDTESFGSPFPSE